jgi:hypothetical protein
MKWYFTKENPIPFVSTQKQMMIHHKPPVACFRPCCAIQTQKTQEAQQVNVTQLQHHVPTRADTSHNFA